MQQEIATAELPQRIKLPPSPPTPSREKPIRVVVYGTLKRGFSNNRLLANATYIEDVSIPGYKLHYSFGNSGFPVAVPDEEGIIKGEIFEIPLDREHIMNNLDRLEAEGHMYNRVKVLDGAYMYVGVPRFWKNSLGKECPKNEFNEYVWGK